MASKKKDPSLKPNHDDLNGYAHLSGITFEILSLNLLIIGGGYYLDKWVGMKIPWILIGSIFLSIAATIFYLLKKYSN